MCPFNIKEFGGLHLQNEIYCIDDPGSEVESSRSLICEQHVAISATRRSFIWLTWTCSPQAVPVQGNFILHVSPMRGRRRVLMFTPSWRAARGAGRMQHRSSLDRLHPSKTELTDFKQRRVRRKEEFEDDEVKGEEVRTVPPISVIITGSGTDIKHMRLNIEEA